MNYDKNKYLMRHWTLGSEAMSDTKYSCDELPNTKQFWSITGDVQQSNVQIFSTQNSFQE